MRALTLLARSLAAGLLAASLAACGERVSGTMSYSDGQMITDTGDPGEHPVDAEVRSLPWRHEEWRFKFNNRQISRLTLAGDQLYIETPDHYVIAMDRYKGRVQWSFHVDTHTPLDWPPVVAEGVPEEKRRLEAQLFQMSRQIDDKMKEVGPGKETQALQKKRQEIREQLRVAAFGDNCYFISRHVLYCLDRLHGDLVWTHRLNFIPSAQPFAIRNYVFVAGVDLARVWALEVENKGSEKTYYKAEIFNRENHVMNRPVYSAPSVYFVCHDGKVYCYNVDTGNLSWTYPTERDLRADPVVYMYRAEEETRPKEAPKAAGGEAPKAGGMEAPKEGAMVAGGMAAPKDDKGKRPMAVPTYRILFVGGMDNAFYAIDGDSGAILWKYECGGVIKAPAVAKDSTVYVKTEEGALHAFEVLPLHHDPKTGASIGFKRNGNLRWKLPLGERFLFKGKDRVYVLGPKSEIYAYKEMTGEIVGRYPTNLLQHLATNTADGYMYVANAGGYVYCLKESQQKY